MDLVFRVLIGDITEDTIISGCRVGDNPNYIAGRALFLNPQGLPDGATIYGVLFNSKSFAVGGFGASPNGPGEGVDLDLNHVKIKDLRQRVNDVPVLYFDKCDDPMSTTITIQKGPFGGGFDLKRAVCESDAALIEQHQTNPAILNSITYTGNPLSDAQIALGEFRGFVMGQDFGFELEIDNRLISWAKGNTWFPSKCADFVCNTNVMFDTNKGIYMFLSKMNISKNELV